MLKIYLWNLFCLKDCVKIALKDSILIKGLSYDEITLHC
ncbi:hypothetical protein HH_1080 [Helicobacter hepaticus ATCC 51449]|uniref:Uncharacterized protein n=1 Tax=Helicobacter hepaticus (strain ATCC 51449 / 3B1) TaxID=235279 RepID=Q7VH87_HELHP|nr:hypothetical protein HH_1080 [Helicobacter hepaticus ATCC 51449]